MPWPFRESWRVQTRSWKRVYSLLVRTPASPDIFIPCTSPILLHGPRLKRIKLSGPLKPILGQLVISSVIVFTLTYSLMYRRLEGTVRSSTHWLSCLPIFESDQNCINTRCSTTGSAPLESSVLTWEKRGFLETGVLLNLGYWRVYAEVEYYAGRSTRTLISTSGRSVPCSA